MTVQILDCLQGTDEWFQARLGIPTASRFHEVLAKGEGKTRAKYIRELAAEKARGWPEPDGYSNPHMERGKAQEPQARALYAMSYAKEPVKQVGFIRNGRAGASPDALVGESGGLEIKSAQGHIQIERLQRNDCPPEHVAQVQGNIWVAEREWWDFMSFSEDLPPLIVRVYRDDAYCARLASAIDAFNEELDSLVASIRTWQDFRSQAA